MSERPRRVAWLLNHVTLHDSEVPMLRELGFEVYTPKLSRTFSGQRSYAVFPDDDKLVTLSAQDLACLNAADMFRPWSAEVAKIFNESFDAIICQMDLGVIDEVVGKFRGQIILRAFGREGPLRYGEFLGLKRLMTFSGLVGRLHFSACYNETNLIEAPALRRIAVHLPMGITERTSTQPDRWHGTGGFLLFVCPDIVKEREYYGRIYDDFRSWFGDLPHRIAGRQPVPVADPAVLGYQPAEAYEELFLQARVMFYHSREPRHLHLHPLEAIARGLPLVYMREGWLGGFSDQPGACRTMGEARALVMRLLGGDQELAERLRSAQRIMLDPFRPAAIKSAWQERFLPLLAPPPVPAVVAPPPSVPRQRIGLWLELRPDSPLRTEGIGRLLGMWLHGLVGAGVEPVVAVPPWGRDQLLDMLGELGFKNGEVEILTSTRVPPIIRMMSWLMKPKMPRSSRLRRWARRWLGGFARVPAQIAQMVVRIGGHVLNWSLVTVVMAMLGFAVVTGWGAVQLGLTMGMVLSTAFWMAIIAVIIAVIVMGRLAFGVVVRVGAPVWQSERFKSLISAARPGELRKGDRFMPFNNPVTRFGLRIYLNAMEVEGRRMVERANARTDITRWIIPNPSFASAAGLRQPLLMCVPDLIYLDFPAGFRREWYAEVDRKVRRLAQRADAFATYSQHVAQRHVARLEPGARQVALIRHAPIDLYGQLYDGSPGERASATNLIDVALHRNGVKHAGAGQRSWLAQLSLLDIPYLFVSSQNRPHKNLLGLLRAFAIILRRRRRSFKLITTGNLGECREVKEFVQAHQLNDDVIAIPDLDPMQHAAAYRMAALTVSPTFFEGGFPFVFSESISVGTPVLLSRIACVEEMLGPADLTLMTFDPHDHEAMADAIIRAVDGRTALLARQREILADQCRRGWVDVGRDLLTALDRAAEHHRGR